MTRARSAGVTLGTAEGTTRVLGITDNDPHLGVDVRPSGSRAAARSALRATLSATVLVYLYFVVPLDGTISLSSGLLLVACLMGLGGLLTWQVRSIASSRSPRLRALEAIGTTLPLLLLVFASSYYLVSQDDGNAFSEPLTRLDALYFTVTVFATVGFGDIAARTDMARTLVTVQMLANLLVIGLGLRVLLGAVQVGLSRQKDIDESRQAGTRDGAVETTGRAAQSPERPTAGAGPPQS